MPRKVVGRPNSGATSRNGAALVRFPRRQRRALEEIAVRQRAADEKRKMEAEQRHQASTAPIKAVAGVQQRYQFALNESASRANW
jgi:hypothetical protein